MNTPLDQLHMIPLLRPLAKTQIENHLATGQITYTHYGKNEIIHFDGDTCKHLEIILSGTVMVERIDVTGHLMSVANFTEGDCIGANLLFSKKPVFPMTVTAAKESSILKMTQTLLFQLCTTNESFLMQFLQIISDHTLLLGATIKHNVNRSIRARLTDYLNRESMNQNSRVIQLTCTKKALAEHMGVQRTSISRELQKMKAEGLIDVDGRTIVIKYA